MEPRKTHNHNRCILHGPYLFYEISVIDVPQSHPSFVPFVLCRSFVFNDTCSCVEQGRRAGRRTWRKRQTMTFTLSIFLLSNWRLQAQAIMWDKRWCGACGPPRSWTWVSWSHVEHGITMSSFTKIQHQLPFTKKLITSWTLNLHLYKEGEVPVGYKAIDWLGCFVFFFFLIIICKEIFIAKRLLQLTWRSLKNYRLAILCT